MKLDRHNYEEYFILYLDNELSEEECRQVEAFASENPDLQAELDVLLQSKVAPDTEITFEHKAVLMSRDSSSINTSNYEEWLLSYVDNELTAQEAANVEKFVASNPGAQKELHWLQLAKLQPAPIVFPNKKSLYRREEKVRVIPMRWWRVAAAAVLLIGISTAAIFLINGKNGTAVPGGMAKSTEPKTITPVIKKDEQQPSNNVESTANNLAEDSNKLTNEAGADRPKIAETKNRKLTPAEKKPEQVQVKEEEPVLAKTKPGNNLPIPLDNPNVTPSFSSPTSDELVGSPITEKVLTSHIGNKPLAAVTLARYDPSDQEPGDNKGGLRGFLRKVTRNFEKRTNIKTTTDDDRLLIAGLSIKLD